MTKTHARIIQILSNQTIHNGELMLTDRTANEIGKLLGMDVREVLDEMRREGILERDHGHYSLAPDCIVI